MTDRERLIELIDKVLVKYDRGCLQFVMNEIADHLLANGVTVQEWISVKDRLPEKRQNVLAVRSDGIIRFDFICSTGCWYEDVNYVGYPVTHWMPLPPEPKGE